jgi:hypothetical protein
MPMDAFYWGMQALREFGARPLNFVLLFVGMIFLGSAKKAGSSPVKKSLSLWVVIILMLTALNLMVPIINGAPSVMGRSPLIQWVLQYLTFIWFFVSIYIWIIWFSEIQIFEFNYRWFIKALISTCLVNLAIFYYDVTIRLVAGHPVQDLLYILKGKLDWRPSGLSSEPSIFGSWVMLIWPLLFFANPTKLGSKKLRSTSRFISVLCILSALLSGARTFLVIFLLQGITYLLFVFKRRKFVGIVGLIVFVGGCFIAWETPILPERFKALSATFECTDIDCSTMTRIGSAVAAANIFMDHPIFGVGLGEFSAYYGQYVPDWALPSEEVQSFISEDISQKVNAFNLFARMGAELGGIILGFFIIFFIWVFYGLYQKTKNYLTNKEIFGFYLGCLLAAIGGVSWWLTQDLFSYQPGIFALAMALYITKEGKQKPFLQPDRHFTPLYFETNPISSP